MTELGRILDLRQYEKGKYLGKGGFGKVYEAREKSTGKLFAAKISLTATSESSDELIHNLLREVNINASIRHASILHFIGFNPKDFENQDFPVIITELAANGSLEDVFDLEGRGLSIEGWNETKKLIMIFGIASGMSFLHSHDIIHRDLKLENILVDERLFPKISDFGLSKIKKKNDCSTNQTNSIAGLKGTPTYLAPEIIENLEYTKAGDIYAFGIVVYEIMTTERAFSGHTIVQLFNAVVRGERPTIDKSVPESYRQLIERCWAQDPNKRPSFDQIVDELQNGEFITPTVDNDLYQEYVNFIKEFKTKYEKNREIVKFDDFVNNSQNQTFQKVSIINITKQYANKKILPVSIYERLNENCQNLVDQSTNDPDKQYTVGISMIEQKKGFPPNLVNYGIKFLERSNYSGCIDAALYLSKLYYEGVLVTHDIKKAKIYLLKYCDIDDDARVFNALARILRDENCIVEARNCYEKGAKIFDPESMFNYGLMLINGEGGDSNIDEALNYLNLAKNHGYESACKFFKISNMLENNRLFSILQPEIKYFFVNQIYMNNKDKIMDKIDINGQINLNSEDIEKLVKKNIFFSEEFINVLESFPCVLINFELPKNYDIFPQMKENQSKFPSNIVFSLIIKKNVDKLNDWIFSKFQVLTKVTIESPSSLSSIGNNAFSKCSSLTEITIPSSVTSIGEYSFTECTSLKKVTIETPSSLFSIGDNAFSKCSSLTEITIPSSVKSIGGFSFSDCTSLKKVTIESHSSLSSIGIMAFSRCKLLSPFKLPPSVSSVGEGIFLDCKEPVCNIQ